jgi:predicted amidohydrolase YtcJ
VAGVKPHPAPDVVITGARIWSDGRRQALVDAVAVGDGVVRAIGAAADVAPLAGPATLRLDAGGATLTPGFTDAHIHLVAWARSRDEVALADAKSRAEVLRRVRERAQAGPAAPVLLGRGWDDFGWSEPPGRAALDAACADRPVLLHRRDYHALWVNSAALAAAGITRETPDPPGGVIERDAAGEPSGVLREHAVRLVAALEPRDAAADLARVRRAVAALHAQGVTAVHDFEGPEAQRVLLGLRREDGLTLRVLMHVAHPALEATLAAGLESGIGDDGFRIGALKLFADGTLGSRTAAMLAPYDDRPGTGMDLIAPAELAVLVRRAFAGGLSVAIHAIGDRACRSALDALEAARPAEWRLALPPRIEHAQLLDPADLPRFARLGVAASMQPSHCVSDLAMARQGWGRRCDLAYAWRALLDTGAMLAFGSDAPVDPPETAAGLSAACTRRPPGAAPREALSPAQAITLDQALTAYTEAPARLAGQWPRVGRIAAGAAADLVLWDRDLHALDPAALAEARPAWTMLGGRIVFDAARSGSPAVPSGAAGRSHA